MSGETSDSKATELEALFNQSMAALKSRDIQRALQFGDRLIEASNSAPAAILWGVRLRLEAQRWQEAIDLGLPSLDKVPGLSGLVGNAFEALAQLSEAQVLYERARSEQPRNAGWYFQDASVLSRLHRDFESMEVLREALKLAPDPGGLQILGEHELAFGNPAVALQTTEQALKLDPRNQNLHVLAARCLMEMNRSDDADKQWKAAESQSPGNETVPLQKSIVLIRHGEFDRGIACLRKMIDKNPKFVPGVVQIATAKRMSEEDRPLIGHMEELLLDPKIGEEDRIALRFALGKAYDHLKEFEKAMIHFDQGNWLQGREIRESGGFDREGYVANMSLRKTAYSKEATVDLARHGNPSTTPIFVLGMIRSGTTLAEQILSSHPWVSGAGEQDFWINADIRLLDYRNRRVDHSELRKAAEVYLRLLSRFAKGASHVVDKQPGNLILAGALHIAYPNARIIHMHRRPVDNAVSVWTTHMRTTTRFVNDKSNIVFAYREHEKLMQHWREVIPPDRFLDVSYESLISDQESMTRKMVEFCGLPWSDECLSPEKNKKLVITPSLWQVRQPVYKTSMDRWKNYEPWLGEFRELLT